MPAELRSLTLGEVGARFGVPRWMIRRLIERGFLPNPERIGNWRVIPERDLPKVKAALLKAGYLKPAEKAGAVADA
jgi:hypothetical protein